jgi:uncharacterized membrane protein (DUF2068 family)
VNRRRPWLSRFRQELDGASPGGGKVMGLIIAERLVKSTALILFAVALVTFGRSGQLTGLVGEINSELNLEVGSTLITSLLERALNFVLRLPHQTLLATGLLLYAGLEMVEGAGLWMGRRWAEYLTVLATSVGIPFEIYEVAHRVTVFRVTALAVNLVIVVYLVWRNRLFIDV